MKKLLVGAAAVALCAGAVWMQSPGSEEAARKLICTPGYSSTYRLHGDAYKRFRDEAFARAGEPTWKQCHQDDPRNYCLIVDHIVPLEVWPPNGADPNDMQNVQLQTKEAAADKDIEENRARYDFCYRSVPLEVVKSRFHRTSGVAEAHAPPEWRQEHR